MEGETEKQKIMTERSLEEQDQADGKEIKAEENKSYNQWEGENEE